MNLVRKVIDARGLPCPQPVILARQALAQGGFELLEITVSDPASRENLLKFAEYAKCAVEQDETQGAETRLVLRPTGAAIPGPQAEPAPAGCVPAGTAVVLITAEGLGRGDEDLGRLLMRGFLYTLAESEAPPRRLIFMNGGVKLAVEGSDSLENLRKLAGRGVEIRSCGTCLEFYKLTDRLAVGTVTNMYDIAECLMAGNALTL